MAAERRVGARGVGFESGATRRAAGDRAKPAGGLGLGLGLGLGASESVSDAGQWSVYQWELPNKRAGNKESRRQGKRERRLAGWESRHSGQGGVDERVLSTKRWALRASSAAAGWKTGDRPGLEVENRRRRSESSTHEQRERRGGGGNAGLGGRVDSVAGLKREERGGDKAGGRGRTATSVWPYQMSRGACEWRAGKQAFGISAGEAVQDEVC